MFELRNLGFTQLVQAVADSEQERHGKVQILQVRSFLSSQKPFGQVLKQLLLIKNVVSEQAVQLIAEIEHFTQGRVHVLQM